jgi:CAF1 family ribonuclease
VTSSTLLTFCNSYLLLCTAGHSDFVGLSVRLSAKNCAEEQHSTDTEAVQLQYRRAKLLAEQATIIELGTACFKVVDNRLTVQAETLLLFSQANSLCSGKQLRDLCSYCGLDMNRWIMQGIPFMTRAEATERAAESARTAEQRRAARAVSNSAAGAAPAQQLAAAGSSSSSAPQLPAASSSSTSAAAAAAAAESQGGKSVRDRMGASLPLEHIVACKVPVVLCQGLADLTVIYQKVSRSLFCFMSSQLPLLQYANDVTSGLAR